MDMFKMMKTVNDNAGLLEELPNQLKAWQNFLVKMDTNLERLVIMTVEIHTAVCEQSLPISTVEETMANAADDPRNKIYTHEDYQKRFNEALKNGN